MKSLLCVVDTCSLIYMRDIEISHKDLRLWLWDEFDIKLSEEICKEIRKHQKLVKGGIQKKCDQSKWKFQIKVGNLEKAFLEPFGVDLNRQKDRGERHNCCVGLEAILRRTHNMVIFLTDELKAVDLNRNGFLSQVFNTFRIGIIWNSLDFILYLFLRHRNRFRFLKAKEALRTINSRIGGPQDVVTKRLLNYNQKLKQIEQTLSRLT